MSPADVFAFPRGHFFLLLGPHSWAAVLAALFLALGPRSSLALGPRSFLLLGRALGRGRLGPGENGALAPKKESADKPGSVLDSHSSGIRVAAQLKRPTRKPMWATCSGD